MKKLSESDEAYEYVKNNRQKIWSKFSDGSVYKSQEAPFSFFMAGAPGSGKTEIVRNHFRQIFEDCVVADADEIRKIIPGYDGKNAHIFQHAVSKGVDILFDRALKKNFNIIVDGTFSLEYEKCRTNISRSIARRRPIVIFYVYTNPKVAWMYAKIREYTEGRKITIPVFVKSFFKCRENIDQIKGEFGEKVYLVGLISNYKKGVKETKVDMQRVDDIKKIGYSKFSLYLMVYSANLRLQRERILWKIKKLLGK